MVTGAARSARCRLAIPLAKAEPSDAGCGRLTAHWRDAAGNAGARRAQDRKAAGVCVRAAVPRSPVGEALRSLATCARSAADADDDMGKNTPEASHAASLFGRAVGISRSDDKRFHPASLLMCPSAWAPASASVGVVARRRAQRAPARWAPARRHACTPLVTAKHCNQITRHRKRHAAARGPLFGLTCPTPHVISSPHSAAAPTATRITATGCFLLRNGGTRTDPSPTPRVAGFSEFP